MKLILTVCVLFSALAAPLPVESIASSTVQPATVSASPLTDPADVICLLFPFMCK